MAYTWLQLTQICFRNQNRLHRLKLSLIRWRLVQYSQFALTIVQRAIGFFRGILFCRYMTDQELGQWSMVYSFLMLLAPLAVLGLPGSFGRFVEHYMQRGQLGTFIRRIANISCVLTLLLAVTMYLFPAEYSQIMFRSTNQEGIVNSMAFAIVMVASINFLSTLMESLRQVRLATVMRFVQGIGFAVFGISLLAFWQNAAAAATLGFGLACFCGCVPAFWFVFKHQNALANTGEKLGHIEMWGRVAPFAAWLWASNLVWNMFEVADRYMLVHWSSTSAELAHGYVGQYHSGRVVPLLLVGVAVVLEGMLLPYMTVLWEKGKPEQAARQIAMTFKAVAVGFTMCAFAMICLSPLLFNVILNGKYDDGLAVLPLTLVYSIWFALFLIGQTYLWVAEQGKYIFFVTLFCLIINLVLNALLIPDFGLWGAVIATSTATFMCLVLVNFANRTVGCPVSRHCWLAGLFPLVIILPFPLMIAAICVGLVAAWKTGLIFDGEEKHLMLEKANSFASKAFARLRKNTKE